MILSVDVIIKCRVYLLSGTSDGSDLLPDRDNKPGTRSDVDEYSAFGHGDDAGCLVKTQDDTEDNRRPPNKSVGSYDDDQQDRVRRPSTTTMKKPSVFADILNTDDICVDSVEQHNSENEEPAVEAMTEDAVEKVDEDEEDDHSEDEEENEDDRRTKSRSSAEESNNDARRRSPDVHRGRNQSITNETSRDGVDYLSGMVHSLCQPGLLPLFSSWSLICIGPSSIYSHSHGK